MKLAELERLAHREVERLQARLSAEIAARAREVPVVVLPRPTRAMVQEAGEEESDWLGLFVGPTLMDELEGADPLPPQILLFVENIWDFAEGDEDVFCEEVRVTYYHELGHYLGLEEDELESRGLE